MMHTIGLHHVFAPIALSVYPICIMCFMKTRELLLLLALTATTGMQAQRIKGSDTVLPIAQQTAERFMTLNPSARVTVTGGEPVSVFQPCWTRPRTSPWLPAPSSSAKR